MPELFFRPSTLDRDIWEEVAHNNIYQLPKAFTSEDVIIDIGAHIGSFAFACLIRGAGLVCCYEASWDNVKALVHNLHAVCDYGPRCQIYHRAVWAELPSRNLPPYLHISDYSFHKDGRLNTGGATVGLQGIETVGVIDIDYVIAKVEKPIRLLKLDCEGAEWPILYGSRYLVRCQEIIGEYHEHAMSNMLCERQVLTRLLSQQGFEVTTKHLPDTTLGYFWAKRT